MNKNKMYTGLAVCSLVGFVVLVGWVLTTLKAILPIVALAGLGLAAYWAINKINKG